MLTRRRYHPGHKSQGGDPCGGSSLAPWFAVCGLMSIFVWLAGVIVLVLQRSAVDDAVQQAAFAQQAARRLASRLNGVGHETLRGTRFGCGSGEVVPIILYTHATTPERLQYLRLCLESVGRAFGSGVRLGDGRRAQATGLLVVLHDGMPPAAVELVDRFASDQRAGGAAALPVVQLFHFSSQRFEEEGGGAGLHRIGPLKRLWFDGMMKMVGDHLWGDGGGSSSSNSNSNSSSSSSSRRRRYGGAALFLEDDHVLAPSAGKVFCALNEALVIPQQARCGDGSDCWGFSLYAPWEAGDPEKKKKKKENEGGEAAPPAVPLVWDEGCSNTAYALAPHAWRRLRRDCEGAFWEVADGWDMTLTNLMKNRPSNSQVSGRVRGGGGGGGSQAAAEGPCADDTFFPGRFVRPAAGWSQAKNIGAIGMNVWPERYHDRHLGDVQLRDVGGSGGGGGGGGKKAVRVHFL